MKLRGAASKLLSGERDVDTDEAEAFPNGSEPDVPTDDEEELWRQMDENSELDEDDAPPRRMDDQSDPEDEYEAKLVAEMNVMRAQLRQRVAMRAEVQQSLADDAEAGHLEDTVQAVAALEKQTAKVAGSEMAAPRRRGGSVLSKHVGKADSDDESDDERRLRLKFEDLTAKEMGMLQEIDDRLKKRRERASVLEWTLVLH